MVPQTFFRSRLYRGMQALLALVALLLTAPAAHRVSHASGGLPSALFDPNDIAWASVRNMTSAQFSTHFTAMKNDGYMVIDIEVDEIDGVQRVGAVWQKNTDGRGWASLRNLTSEEFSAKWTFYKDQGYRPIDQDVYTLGGQRYYSGVWVQNKEGLAWVSYRNVSSETFSANFQQYSDAGYIPIDVEAYQVGTGLQYAAIWVKNSEGLAWKLWRDLSAAEYAEKFQAYKGTYRVLDFESYQYNSQQRYAAIWIENKNGRAWQAWREMTAKEFGDKWEALRDAGYRLTDYEAYPTTGGTRYAGVWRQNGERPSWPQKSAVDALLETHADQFDIPGMSVAIAHKGQFVYLRGFGYADIDDDKRATSHTIYRLASVSKAVAGVLTMQLVEQNELELGQTTRSYVPSMPRHHTHTIQQTVSNRSGVGHYEDHGSANEPFATALAACGFFWNDPLLYTPGTGTKYSTHAYTLLGAAMEGAVGQPIANIIEQELTNNYQLPTLRAEDRSQPNAQRATLYESDNDEATADDISWKVLGGGMEASAYDMARLGIKLLDGDILSEESLDTMWTAPDGLTNYALGWSTGQENGTRVVAKDGAQNGANSYIRIYPDKEIVIVVLTNRNGGGHSAVTMGREIGKIMLAAE